MVAAEVFEWAAGIFTGGVDPDLGPGGVLAQAHRTAVAAAPVLSDQAVQCMVGGAGDFLQGRAHYLGDQFEACQVADGSQDVGGVGALGGAFADQAVLFQRTRVRSRRRSAWPSRSRWSRKSVSTLWWKPEAWVVEFEAE
ncbi:hypothetical protein [Kitasatospora sp. SolWspMP-SS2h]|uniref:hypothetical protein n=1 Tax=Kitasatospora sp. SolWspMP-SS2h TaxID=1305729 RepID=UPI001F19EE9E|nr:hypothetical protein [Kitasatospora sp. SolWspMP-SS2h]